MADYPTHPEHPYSQHPFGERYYRQPPPGHQPLWPWFILLLLFIGGLLAWRYWPSTGNNGLDVHAAPRPVTPRGKLADIEEATIKVFQETSPSVVQVNTVALEQDQFSSDVEEIQGLGSGFVWDKKGHIVTNYHVVKSVVEREAGSVKVTLADHSTWDARWVRAYPDKDLAVLWIKAPANRLQPIMIGTSHNLKVGQIALAIGNPFGLSHTLTKGIVSALNRDMESVNHTTISGVIQTDAAINPGNSGGPLLDSAGRLIGVNTAIRSPSRANAGIGFAIPVDEVNRIIPQLIRNGRVVHPDLGLVLADDQQMQSLGLEGVLVLRVKPGSPAAQAGLRPTRRLANGHIQLGDLIVAVNGQAVHSQSDFFKIVDQSKAGDQVTITVDRDGEKKDLKLTITDQAQG